MFKNTLARRAVEEAGVVGVTDLLEGPVALAFVKGDAAAAAKALREFAKTNPTLVVKGGLLGDRFVGPADIEALADLPSREVLLAQIAGAFQAPLVKAAGLFQALPRNLAYGVKALIDQRIAAGESAPVAEEAPADEAPAADEAPVAEAADAPEAAEAPAADAARGRRAEDPPRTHPRRRVRVTPRVSETEGTDIMATSTEELLEQFKSMTVLELNDFLKAFEEEFGVTAAAPVAVAAAAPAAGGGGDAAAEEKDEFDVILVAAGDKKIQVHQGGPRHRRRASA